MATKTQRPTVARTEVETLTGTIHGKRYTVVLDDISHSDEWDPAILPVLQADGIGKVNLVDGVTEFQFRDSEESTIQFSAKAGNLVVVKFFKLQVSGGASDDSVAESV